MMALGILEIAYALHGDEAEVLALMKKYADTPMDLADACLVRIIEQHTASELLTVDSDFFVYRRHGNQTIDVVHP